MTTDVNFLAYSLKCKRLQLQFCPAHKLDILLAEISELERLIIEQKGTL